MFIHAAYFWLRKGLSAGERRQFEDGVRSLMTIDTVERAYTGVPASTDRPVIDRSYSYGLVVVFHDQAGHDIYQEHPVHDRFRKACAGLWTRVQIYDTVTGPLRSAEL
jgi:hypothetical protein